MTGPGQFADAADLRELERLLGSRKIPTAFVPDMQAAGPGLVVLTPDRLEVARVHISRRGRTFMVKFLMGPGTEERRLMVARTAEQAASTIAAYRGSGPLSGVLPDHGADSGAE